MSSLGVDDHQAKDVGQLGGRRSLACAKALIAANSALVPAKIGFGVATESRIQRNRREHPGHFDPEVGLIKVTHADGAPLAVLLNFAMHASAVPPESLLISADAVGVAEKTIERELGGKVVAIWAQGAEGDVSPKHKGFEGIEKSGGMLAHTVLAALDDIATESTIDLDVATTTVRFRKPKLHYSCDRPGDSEESPLIGELNFCEIYKLVSGSSFSVGIPLEGLIERSFPFKVLRMGKTVILFVPGEPLTTLGLELKAGAKALGYETPFVFGLSNDHMSYVADKASYEEGGYEAIATLFGKDQAAIVKKTLLTLAKELVPEAD